LKNDKTTFHRKISRLARKRRRGSKKEFDSILKFLRQKKDKKGERESSSGREVN